MALQGDGVDVREGAEREVLERVRAHGAVVAHHTTPHPTTPWAVSGIVADLGSHRRGQGPQHWVLGPVGHALLEVEQSCHIITKIPLTNKIKRKEIGSWSQFKVPLPIYRHCI
jgi:CTP:molybdopterin cytidylyltransferase MocA